MGSSRVFDEETGLAPEDADFDDPPPPEFDRDAMYALAIPCLREGDRARIICEAREWGNKGLQRKELGDWICREVARTVGGAAGFDAFDEFGNPIAPPEIAAARREAVRETKQRAGQRR